MALSGRIGASKTSVAKHLEKLGYTRLSFASALKHDVAEYFNIPLEDLFDPNKKDQYRETLQLFGEAARKYIDGWWIARLIDQNKNLLESGLSRLVIDDMRHVSEYEAVKELGFITVRLFTEEEECIQYLMEVRDYQSRGRALMVTRDISETALLTVPHDIVVQGGNRPIEDIVMDISKEYIGRQLKVRT